MEKLRVGLLFGGRSVEHEVSVSSAGSILKALDPERYDVTLVAIDSDGRWHVGAPSLPLESAVAGDEVNLPVAPGPRTLVPVGGGSEAGAVLDVVFPIVHGRGGEDGALQGLLELAGVPYVGSGVLGSALQMDKEVAKRLLRAADIPVTPWLAVRSGELERRGEALVDQVVETLGLPVFAKPANLGSSVGISRCAERDQVIPALREAFRYDAKVLVETAIDAREIEVALLGNDPVVASVPGEIRTQREFYDYEAKYVDEDTELLIPAPIDDAQRERAQQLAVRAFEALEGSGIGRVDFLLDRHTGEFFVNEVNSLPGFTEGSMFPLLWNASGLSYPALLDRLIELALERHRATSAFETQYRRT